MEVYIYGEIGSNGVTLKQISDQIKGAEKVTVHINSPGGEVFEGIAISNILKTIPESEAIIEGLCASISTVIASSCKVVKMYPNAQYMIHNAWVGTEGDKNQLRKQIDMLSIMDKQIMEAYTSKTSLNSNDIQTLMDAETWMTADEAKEKGFIDEIIQPEYKAVAKLNLESMKFFDKINNLLSGVKNMIELKLADGKTVSIEAEPGAEVGAAVMVDGAPAPVGEHPLEDGRVLVVVEEGKVAEIKLPAPAKTEDPMEDRFKQLENAIEEIAAKLGAFGSVEKKIENKLAEEITALKSQIVGTHKPSIKKVEKVTSKDIKIEDIQRAKAEGRIEDFKNLYQARYGVEPKV